MLRPERECGNAELPSALYKKKGRKEDSKGKRRSGVGLLSNKHSKESELKRDW